MPALEMRTSRRVKVDTAAEIICGVSVSGVDLGEVEQVEEVEVLGKSMAQFCEGGSWGSNGCCASFAGGEER
jgi:hypothetical protein